VAEKNTISTRISLEGAEDIIKAFRAMGAEGEEVAKKLESVFAAIGIGKNVVSNIEKVKAAFRSLGVAAQTVGKSFKNVGDSFNRLGTAVGRTRNRLLLFTAAVAGVGFGFQRIVQGSLDTVGALSDLSESLNISAEDLQAFNFAAAQIGVNEGDFTKGIVAINDALKELRGSGAKALSDGVRPAIESVAVAGGKVITVYRGIQTQAKDSGKATDGLSDRARTLAKVFNAMGVSVNKDLTEFETLKVIANYFKDVAKEGDKLGLAVDLFGPKLGPKLVRYLNLGADGIEGFKTELRDLGVLLSGDEVALGDKAGDQIAAVGKVFEGFRNKLAVSLAPGIIAATDAIFGAIKENADDVNAFLAQVGDGFGKFIQDVITLASGTGGQLNFPWLQDFVDGLKGAISTAQSLIYDVLIPGFTALSGFLQPIATLMNDIFGTEFTGTGLILAGVVLQLIGGFGLLAAAIGTVGTVIGAVITGFGLLSAVPAAIVAAFLVAGVAIYAFWDEIAAAAATAWAAIREVSVAAWAGIVQVLNNANDAFVNGVVNMRNRIIAIWGNLTQKIRELWNAAISSLFSVMDTLASRIQSIISSISNAIARARSLVSSTSSSSTGGGGGYASGGYIRGPGTGTSDSIPAWLSNGEFVIRASAVRKYGAQFLAAINGMRLSPNAIGRFAMGGLVGLPAMQMASLPAGASGPTSSLTLVLDNQQFAGLSGSADTIARLERAIKTRRIRSTGRPSPYER